MIFAVTHVHVLAFFVALLAVVGAPGRMAAQQRDVKPPPAPQPAEKRLALVIGNSAYPVGPLKNPVNDARAMAKVLRDVGFEVLVHENLDQKGMRRAIIDFGAKLGEGGGVGLFYYAGHGMQVAGRNYMIPELLT
jgi:hypothetical protein